ncbi:MAG: hypothetical protein QOJ94_2904 [Sphingomonadales bacterium]|nr:hypothetical protein [Sphingomonadales bacterium]
MNGMICLALAAVGLGMILLGIFMTWRDWRTKRFGNAPSAREEALANDFEALAKLVAALKNSPPGISLIVLGIALLFVALAFCGISGIVNAVAG